MCVSCMCVRVVLYHFFSFRVCVCVSVSVGLAQGGVIVVEAEAGMGKTRFVQAIVEQIQADRPAPLFIPHDVHDVGDRERESQATPTLDEKAKSLTLTAPTKPLRYYFGGASGMVCFVCGARVCVCV